MTTPPDETMPVRSDVPLNMHPDALMGFNAALSHPDTLGLSVMSAGRAALSLCYDLFGRLNDAERDLQAAAEPAVRRQHPADRGGRTEITSNIRMVNGKPTRIVSTEEFVEAAEQAFARTSPVLDRRLAELQGYRDALAKRVETALDAPARRTPEGLALASEVRSHIKALKRPDQRAKFVMDAVEAGDLPTVSAVLHAPPFLSGLDAGMHSVIRTRAASRFAPVDSAQLDATDVTIEHVAAAGSAIVKRYGGVMALRKLPVVQAAKSVKALREG
jgi:hypothetical protein